MKKLIVVLFLSFLFINTFLINNKVKAQAFSIDTTFNINYNFYNSMLQGIYPEVNKLYIEPNSKFKSNNRIISNFERFCFF